MRTKAFFLCLLLWSFAWLAPALAAPTSRDRIANEAQFNELTRTAAGGRYFSVPQLQFAIDRTRGRSGRLYFINSRLYEYHIDFVVRTFLSADSIDRLVADNYSKPDRRFIFGSIVYYPGLKRYGVEFFENDVIQPAILHQAMTQLQANFFAPLALKPNSIQQYELAAATPGLAVIDGGEAYGSRSSLVLNPGRAVGRLRFVEEVTPDLDLAPDEILVIDVPPVRMAPVAGIITTAFSTPLSHVNLLAKSWRIPNAYLKDAKAHYRRLEGKIVFLDTTSEQPTLRLASASEIARSQRVAEQALRIPAADLAYVGLPSLAEQRSSDSVRLGAKSANLGEVARRLQRVPDPDFAVPPGFTLPFSAYAAFVKANGLDQRIEALLANPEVRGDRAKRRAALADLRAAFARGRIDPDLLAAVNARRAAVIGQGGVFARSSTNAEDLPGFNGAGLYTSVPNVVSQAQLADAIRAVWGSVWNDAAFEAREAGRIDHRAVAAAVLIQQGVNAEASGVMITENPFDTAEEQAVFINAKRGLGMRVVEGKALAEQIVFHTDTNGSIQLMNRSDDRVMLAFDPAGGVRAIAIEPGRFVLTDALTRRLAQAGLAIQAWFKGRPQDIEWVTVGDKVYVVQSRPYLRGY